MEENEQQAHLFWGQFAGESISSTSLKCTEGWLRAHAWEAKAELTQNVSKPLFLYCKSTIVFGHDLKMRKSKEEEHADSNLHRGGLYVCARVFVCVCARVCVHEV